MFPTNRLFILFLSIQFFAQPRANPVSARNPALRTPVENWLNQWREGRKARPSGSSGNPASGVCLIKIAHPAERRILRFLERGGSTPLCFSTGIGRPIVAGCAKEPVVSAARLLHPERFYRG